MDGIQSGAVDGGAGLVDESRTRAGTSRTEDASLADLVGSQSGFEGKHTGQRGAPLVTGDYTPATAVVTLIANRGLICLQSLTLCTAIFGRFGM